MSSRAAVRVPWECLTPSAEAAVKPHILLVEDEVPLSDLLTLYFEHNGFRVTTSGTVDRAKFLLAATKFDVVILDLNLDGQDGLAVLHYVRAMRLDLPVIIHTGLEDDTPLFRKALEGRAEGFVRKGGSLEGLLAEVRRVL